MTDQPAGQPAESRIREAIKQISIARDQIPEGRIEVDASLGRAEILCRGVADTLESELPNCPECGTSAYQTFQHGGGEVVDPCGCEITPEQGEQMAAEVDER